MKYYQHEMSMRSQERPTKKKYNVALFNYIDGFSETKNVIYFVTVKINGSGFTIHFVKYKFRFTQFIF